MATGHATATVTEVNDAPVANLGGPYSGKVAVPIAFDGSGSSDYDNQDGIAANDQVLSYTWNFGDGSSATTVTASHAYATVGTYAVSLTVSDGTATNTHTTSVYRYYAPIVSTMHVGDLDGTSSSVNTEKWTASVSARVLDGSGCRPSATVQGTWSNGISSTASTDATGLATVSSGNVDKSIASVTFTVTNIVHATLSYDPNANMDPDIPAIAMVWPSWYSRTVIRHPPPSLLAAALCTLATSGEMLTQQMAEVAASQAMTLWSQQVTALPSVVHVNVMDLPAGTLGWAYGDTITLDVNADGAGWYMNPGAPAAGHMDLLTVVSHEVGHLLGYDHSADSHDLMAATLPVGTRRLPGLGHVELASSPLAPLSLPLSTATPDIALTARESLVRTLSTNAAGQPDLQPLPMQIGQPSTSSPASDEKARLLSEVLDEQTELLDEEPLDLLARLPGNSRNGSRNHFTPPGPARPAARVPLWSNCLHFLTPPLRASDRRFCCGFVPHCE